MTQREKEKETFERVQRQYKRQNEYIKQKYYRTTATLPKDYPDRLKAVGVTSMNQYINDIIKEDLERREKEMGIEHGVEKEDKE